jgi:hypothetical protein
MFTNVTGILNNKSLFVSKLNFMLIYTKEYKYFVKLKNKIIESILVLSVNLNKFNSKVIICVSF